MLCLFTVPRRCAGAADVREGFHLVARVQLLQWHFLHCMGNTCTPQHSHLTQPGHRPRCTALFVQRAAVAQTRRKKRVLQWCERPISTVALLSSSGANKSAILDELQACVEDTMKFHKMPPFIATDYTVESIMAQMADTDGTSLLILDEMKKIKAVDEYKKGKEGGGKQRLMELQAGVKFRVLRKGGPKALKEGASPSQDDESGNQHHETRKQSVSVLEARSHLNIVGTTHIHTGVAWFKEHQGQTDGEMTRYDCVTVDAEYNDLPDRGIMEQLGASVAEGADLFLLLNVVKVTRDVLIEKLSGDIFLQDGAYTLLQKYILEDFNPALRSLASCSSAGSQVSSWSKTKGKVIKYGGGVFMISTAEEICIAYPSIGEFDFDTNSAADFSALVAPLVVEKLGLDSSNSVKLINETCLEYGYNWAMMFHETGLALQQCMVPRSPLPPLAELIQQTPESTLQPPPLSTAAMPGRRLAHSVFGTPLDWGVYSVIMSPKLEDGIISASHMTVVC